MVYNIQLFTSSEFPCASFEHASEDGVKSNCLIGDKYKWVEVGVKGGVELFEIVYNMKTAKN